MDSLVRGLRPCRAGRRFTINVPNPTMLTDSPLARAYVMTPRTALTAASASLLLRSDIDLPAAGAPQVSSSSLRSGLGGLATSLLAAAVLGAGGASAQTPAVCSDGACRR